jgi:hypothetical protein
MYIILLIKQYKSQDRKRNHILLLFHFQMISIPHSKAKSYQGNINFEKHISFYHKREITCLLQGNLSSFGTGIHSKYQ